MLVHFLDLGRESTENVEHVCTNIMNYISYHYIDGVAIALVMQNAKGKLYHSFKVNYFCQHKLKKNIQNE